MAHQSELKTSTTAPRAGAFSFGTWIRLHGVDIITMALMGAVGLGVYYARQFYPFLSLIRIED